MTNKTVNKFLFIVLVSIYSCQTHAAATIVDAPSTAAEEPAPHAHTCVHTTYIDTAGGGERRPTDPSIDEGWRWCQNLWINLNGKIFSFRETHTAMREIEKKVSGAWNNIRSVIRRDMGGIDIGYGNIALAALTFVVEDAGIQTPITIHVKDATGAPILFESGFKETVLPAVESFKGTLPVGTPPPRDATKALTTLSTSPLKALQEVGEDAEALYVNLRKLFEEGVETHISYPSPKRVSELLAKVNFDHMGWRETFSGGVAESKDEPVEPSIDLIHSEQIIRLFLQSPDNLAPIFTELRTKMSGMSAEAKIILGISHYHSRVDLCPLCSTTLSTDCAHGLETSVFSKIFQIMRRESFNVSADAGAILFATSRETPGRKGDPATGIRRETHGLPLVHHVSPARTNRIRAFHQHPDAKINATPERALSLAFSAGAGDAVGGAGTATWSTEGAVGGAGTAACGASGAAGGAGTAACSAGDAVGGALTLTPSRRTSLLGAFNAVADLKLSGAGGRRKIKVPVLEEDET